MSLSNSQTLSSHSPELASCRRRTVWLVGAVCLSFVFLTSLYCYLSALYLGSFYATGFWSTLRCVSIDWLGWAVVSPLLAHAAIKEDISTRAGVLAVIRLLVTATLVLGASRMAMEHLLGRDTLLQTLIYFVPRYLFVTAFFVGAGVFYVYKTKADLEIQRLKDQRAKEAQQPDASLKQLVVYKGNCRAVVQCQDVISITASGNYLELETENGCYLMRCTMKNIESQLNPQQFVRIHRSHIVNLDHIESVSRSRLEANLANGSVLRIGKKYLNALPHLAPAASPHIT
jgi:hypothetical protein